MNCEQLCECLPLLIYGDLDGEKERDATAHLASCPACRQQRDALRETREALDAVAIPEPAVDLAAIHAHSIAMQTRATRRWKRFAIAAAALAAGLLIVLLIRPEIRVGDGQLIVRWRPAPEPPQMVAQSPPARDGDLEERIRLLNSLVHALQKQVEGNEQQARKDVEYLLVCLELLRVQSQQQLEEARRDFSLLHTAQSGKRD